MNICMVRWVGVRWHYTTINVINSAATKDVEFELSYLCDYAVELPVFRA